MLIKTDLRFFVLFKGGLGWQPVIFLLFTIHKVREKQLIQLELVTD